MKEVFRRAERGTRDDASRLVDAVPALMREAARRRTEASDPFPELVRWALPRLATATASAVVLAATVLLWDRPAATTPTLESVILDAAGSETGDVVLDALLGSGRRDG